MLSSTRPPLPAEDGARSSPFGTCGSAPEETNYRRFHSRKTTTRFSFKLSGIWREERTAASYSKGALLQKRNVSPPIGFARQRRKGRVRRYLKNITNKAINLSPGSESIAELRRGPLVSTRCASCNRVFRRKVSLSAARRYRLTGAGYVAGKVEEPLANVYVSASTPSYQTPGS
jgi:hypothetical protein